MAVVIDSNEGGRTMATTTRRAKTVEQGMLTGQGATVTEAKASLKAKVEAALTGSYEPATVTHGAYTAIVFRQPDGWYYKLRVSVDYTVSGILTVYASNSGEADRDASIQRAASHVIDIGSGDDEIHGDGDIPAWLTNVDYRRTILGNARFRRAWRWAKENKPEGLDTDHEWHRWACHNDRDPRFA